MRTLESTISMLRVLPEAEAQVAFDIAGAMLEKQSSPFAPVNRENLLRDIDLSTEQFARGEAHGAGEVISVLRAKYGLQGRINRGIFCLPERGGMTDEAAATAGDDDQGTGF